MTHFEILYEYTSPHPHMYFMWVSLLSLIAVIGFWFSIGAPRFIEGKWRTLKETMKYKKTAREAKISGVSAFLISVFLLWAIVTGQGNRVVLESKIANMQINIIQGEVTKIARMMPVQVKAKTVPTRTDYYWYYTQISLQENIFYFGPGTRNPSFKHYFFDDPPIKEGDTLRISYIGKKLTKVEILKN